MEDKGKFDCRLLECCRQGGPGSPPSTLIGLPAATVGPGGKTLSGCTGGRPQRALARCVVSLLEMGIFFKKQRSAAAGIVLCTVEQIVVKEDVVRIRTGEHGKDALH